MAGRRRWWKPSTGRCKVSWCSPAAPTWTGWRANAPDHTGRRREAQYKSIFESFINTACNADHVFKLTSWSSPKHLPSYRKGSAKRVESLCELWTNTCFIICVLKSDRNHDAGCTCAFCATSSTSWNFSDTVKSSFGGSCRNDERHVDLCWWTDFSFWQTGSCCLTMGSNTSGTMLHWILQPLENWEKMWML